MRRHLSYLSYVLRHKYFVFVAGLKLGCPIWRLLTHDLSKFLPGEWGPYARNFYNEDGSKAKHEETSEFQVAWWKHQHRNDHHWQYWLLFQDSGGILCMDMPNAACVEMVADWAGAGRAICGKWDLKEWYATRCKAQLSPATRTLVDVLVASFPEG